MRKPNTFVITVLDCCRQIRADPASKFEVSSMMKEDKIDSGQIQEKKDENEFEE